MYRIANGQVEQVTSLPNVSGVELYLQSLPVSERQAMGIFARMIYGAFSEPVASVADDCIYAPVPAQPEPIKEPLTFNRLKLIEALDRRDLLPALDAYMAQDAKAKWYFTTASILEDAHPVFVEAMTTLKNATGMSDGEINAIFEESKN